MINVDGLYVKYVEKEVLSDVNLKIKERLITTIIGPNGCGKSTLLKVISKNLKSYKGIVSIDGTNLRTITTRVLARSLAILPQNPIIPMDFSVKELVGFGRYPFIRFGGRLTQNDYRVIDWALEKTDMKGYKCRRVSTLSGGERQRAWIAMALAQEPKILLLDEPTTYLDISHQFEILELVKEINKNMQMTVIMVLHDINHASKYSDEIVVLKDGALIKHGTPSEIVNREMMEHVFSLKGKFLEQSNYPHFIPEKSYR